MKLTPIKANMTEVEFDDKIVLFSYKTPVAYFDKNGMLFYKTSKKWSRTTSKHITQWIGTDKYGNQYVAKDVDQSELDNLVK